MSAPVSVRGAGFGLDAELARKRSEKYDYVAERQVQQWIEAVTGTKFTQPFAQNLKDGQLLCHLINKIKPGTIRKVETSSMPFKQMENISNFLRACRSLGVAEHDVFETVDLFEAKDISVVIMCLMSLSRVVQKTVPSFAGPHVEGIGAPPSPVADVTEAAAAMTINASSAPSTSSRPAMPSTPPPLPPSAAPTPPANKPPPPPPKPSPATPANKTESSPGVKTASVAASSVVKPRGGGYGLDAELAQKAADRYDTSAEAQAIQWIEQLTHESFTGSTFAARLKSGEVLCKLVNAIKPETIKKYNANTSMPFKQMENISSFLRACRTLGVSEHDLFETVDLFEEKDMSLVLRCIFALGRVIQTTVPGFSGPVLGPRMAQANKREFTEEQMAKARQESGMTKIMTGSYGFMDRSEVSKSNDVTFGAATSGTGDAASTSALSDGSRSTMDRTYISKSKDITFGADAGKS